MTIEPFREGCLQIRAASKGASLYKISLRLNLSVPKESSQLKGTKGRKEAKGTIMNSRWSGLAQGWLTLSQR